MLQTIIKKVVPFLIPIGVAIFETFSEQKAEKEFEELKNRVSDLENKNNETTDENETEEPTDEWKSF